MPHRARPYIKSLISIGFIIAVGLGAAAFAQGLSHTQGLGHGKDAQRVDPAARPVLVAVIHFAPEQPTRSFMATIRPRVEADQGFRVSGKVAARLVDVGRSVKAGEPLARLDETDLRLQKEQAEAELQASRVAVEQTEADEKRGGDLRAKGWTSQAGYDRQHAAAEEARGRNRRAQRAVELAANALDYAILRADSDGVVTATLVEPGQVVSAGQPAMRLARRGEKEAAVAIPESFVGRAREGAATLTLFSDPGRVHKAVLREMSPVADPATRTFAARFSLPEADGDVALGMSATLSIAPSGSGNVARVPASALFDQGQGQSLWVVGADGRVAMKPVRVLRYEGSDVLVSAGVAEGERIVTLGVQKLDAGEKVRAISQLSF